MRRCKFCGKQFEGHLNRRYCSNECNYKNHIEVYHKVYKCFICGKSCYGYRCKDCIKLKTNKSGKSKKWKNRYQIIEALVKGRWGTVIHQYRYMKNDKPLHKCPICNTQYVTDYYFEKHLLKFHKGLKITQNSLRNFASKGEWNYR